jgi:CRP-like cAMP-binding protein
MHPSAPPPPGLFDGLAEDTLQAIRAKTQVLHLPAHTRIFEAGEASESVYIVQGGRVRTFMRTQAGEEVTTGLWSLGSLLGLIGSVTSSSKVLSAETLDAVTLQHLTRNELRELVSQHPPFAWNLVRSLGWMTASSIQRGIRLASAPVAHRLTDVLVMLAELPDAQTAEGLVIEGVNQETIASMVGATRPWVAQSLSELARRGLITQKRLRILIPDLARLRAEGLQQLGSP